jgi:hypothetical protein
MPPTCNQTNKHLDKFNARGGPERDHTGNQSEGKQMWLECVNLFFYVTYHKHLNLLFIHIVLGIL